MKPIRAWVARDNGSLIGTFFYAKKPKRTRLPLGYYYRPMTADYFLISFEDVGLRPGQCVEVEIREVKRKGGGR